MTTEHLKLIARNRKAYFEYTIDDLFEAGLVLRGTEVKSLRLGKANYPGRLRPLSGRGDLFAECPYQPLPPCPG